MRGSDQTFLPASMEPLLLRLPKIEVAIVRVCLLRLKAQREKGGEGEVRKL